MYNIYTFFPQFKNSFNKYAIKYKIIIEKLFSKIYLRYIHMETDCVLS